MQSSKETTLVVTPKINAAYTDFKLVSQTSYYKTYEAKARVTGQRHSLRILDTTSQLFLKDRNLAFTLFMQEILRLCMRLARTDTIIIENFDIYGDVVIFAMKPYYPIEKDFITKTQTTQTVDIEKMLKDILSDLNFLHTKLNIGGINIDSKNIFHIEEINCFFVGDWSVAKPVENPNLLTNASMNTVEQEAWENKMFANEIYTLGLLILELCGVTIPEFEDLLLVHSDEVYNFAVANLAKRMRGRGQSEAIQKLVPRMLQKNPSEQIAINELLLRYGKDWLLQISEKL